MENKQLKIAFIGGGSYMWGPWVSRDLFVTKELDGSKLVLLDINEESLADIKAVTEKMQKRVNSNWDVETTTDRQAALKDADYVIICISTGGFDSMEHDINVPWKHGVFHSVGDTVGPGGLNRALRNIPVVVDIMNDVNELCPEAWVMNITNPMTTLTSAMAKVSKSGKVVGMCHEVSGGRDFIGNILGFEGKMDKDLEVVVAGLNHNIWLLDATYKSKSIMEEIKEACSNKDIAWENYQKKMATMPTKDSNGKEVDLTEKFEKMWKGSGIRRLMLHQTGFLAMQGDRHTAENYGHITSNQEAFKALGGHFTPIEGRRKYWLPGAIKNAKRIMSGEWTDYEITLSHEPIVPIIKAIETGERYLWEAGNMVNVGQISNLPIGAVVETPCIASSKGVVPVTVGNVPSAIAAQLNGHAYRQEMIVEAAMTTNKELALAALASDPMVTDITHTEDMLNEMMDKTAQWLPNFYPDGKAPERTYNYPQKEEDAKTISAEESHIPAEITER
ncbi:MAG: hypothetical protein DRH57_08740 [Candidatus Cloacimonadota bacterium]|nr:MAG: hypothetical protein DRH57_08740 [Candidatus Cloacimonadota bacterium]